MIGLTSEQLLINFLDFTEGHLGQLTGELEAIAAGESPETAKKLKELYEKIPGLDVQQAKAIASILMALMDIIVSNNEALGKVIPHVDA